MAHADSPDFTNDEYEIKLLLHKPRFKEGILAIRKKWEIPATGFPDNKANNAWLERVENSLADYQEDIRLLMRDLELAERWYQGISYYTQNNLPGMLRVQPANSLRFKYDGEPLYRRNVRSVSIEIDADTTQRELLERFEEAKELLGVDKKKNQAGPRKNGNPKYPMSNHVSCELCLDKPKRRYVGFDHGNGDGKHIYEKYRCRSCGRYLTRQVLHAQVEKYFKQRQITTKGMEALIKSLNTVWDQKEGQAEQEARRLKYKIESVNNAIADQVEAATDPSNAEIKQNILDSIAKKKSDIADLEDELSKIKHTADADKERFMRFALNFVNNMGSEFLTIAPEHRLRCKQLLFPAGFYLDADNRVYTPEISPIYGLATIKKSPEGLDYSHLVRVKRL